MIEERHRIKHATDIDKAEQGRLDRFLKITANATAYGALARFDRRDLADPVSVTVYGPGSKSFRDTTVNPEDPGPFCFPPVAASITAGARLMLALIERALRDEGGCYAFMDTDSIAIVATPAGGPMSCPTSTGTTVEALSHEAVRQLLRRFNSLNPYGPDVVNDDPALGRSPWKVEHDSLDDPLWCYAIAAKRYALFRRRGSTLQLAVVGDAHEESSADVDTTGLEAADELGDWSEHGLGLYLDPSDRPRRDKNRRRLWTRDAWQWVLHQAAGGRPELPAWSDRYAVTQFSVSSPKQGGWFRLDDTGGAVAGKPRPFGFGLLSHVDPFGSHFVDGHPAAPFDSKPSNWATLPWYDRHTGHRVSVAAADQLGDDPTELADALVAGVLPLRTIGDIVRTYPDRPEHKSQAPDGRPASSKTAGLLQRRPIRSAPVLTALIGKEGNRLLERQTGEVTDPGDYRTNYSDPGLDRWKLLVLPVLQEIRDALGAAHIATAVGVSDRQVRNWLAGRDVPHSGASQNRQRVERLAVDWAGQQLRGAGRRVPADPSAALYSYRLTITS